MLSQRASWVSVSVLLALGGTRALGAQVLDFSTVACSGSGSQNLGNSVTQNGYVVSAAPTFDLAEWCDGNANAPGAPAIFFNTVGSGGMLTAAGGAAFSLHTIDLAQLFVGPNFNEVLTFTGHLVGGSTVTQSFTVPGQASGAPVLSTYLFQPTFANLTSVDFAGQNHYQFTNVVLNVSAVPEPSALALLGTGALGLIGVNARRRHLRSR